MAGRVPRYEPAQTYRLSARGLHDLPALDRNDELVNQKKEGTLDMEDEKQIADAADAADDESDFDGCDVEVTDETPDEELPEAEGGVA